MSFEIFKLIICCIFVTGQYLITYPPKNINELINLINPQCVCHWLTDHKSL